MDYPTVRQAIEKVKDADQAIIDILEEAKTLGMTPFPEANKLLEAREFIQKALNCLFQI